MPLEPNDTLAALRDSIEQASYSSRALLHARRLLALYLVAHSSHQQLFGVRSTSSSSTQLNDIFHSNPMKYDNKKFENESEVFVSGDVTITPAIVIESYNKSIRKF